MCESVLLREWYSDTFHQRVLDLEAQGYVARWNTYQITPEMNPDTGIIIHLYTIEMNKPRMDTPWSPPAGEPPSKVP